MAGDSLSSGRGLEHYVEAYRKLDSVTRLDDARAWMNKVFTAVSINYLWRRAFVYIVMSDTTDCEADERGPNYLKICDDARPQYVFYMSHISPFGEREWGTDYPRVGSYHCFETSDC